MDTKFCPNCGLNKTIEEFNKNKNRKDGVQGICRVCDREKAAISYHEKYKDKHIVRATKRKKELRNWLTEYKKTKACEKCGDTRWYVLDFHHNENKDDSVSQLVVRGCSKDRVLKEIAKCKILCSNCHREFHFLKGL